MVFHNIGTKRCGYPANAEHSPNAVSMLAHRLRRWPNIETALCECPVFAGLDTRGSPACGTC